MQLLSFQLPIGLFFSLLLLVYLICLYEIKSVQGRIIFAFALYMLPTNLFRVGAHNYCVSELFAIFVIILVIYKLRYNKIVKNDFGKVFYIFICALIISTFSPVIYKAIFEDVHEVLSFGRRSVTPALFFMLFSYALAKIELDRKLFFLFVTYFFVLGCLIMVDGYFGFIFGFWKSLSAQMHGVGERRLATLIVGGCDNVVRLLPLGILSAYIIGKKKNKNSVFLGYIFFSFPIFLFSLSRTGMILLILTYVLIVFYNLKKKFLPYFIFIFFVFFFCQEYFLNKIDHFFVENRKGNVGLIHKESLDSRFERWEQLGDTVRNDYVNFLLGVGYNNFQRYLSDKYGLGVVSSLIGISSLHSTYFEILVGLGLLGLLYIICLLYFIFKHSFRIFFKDLYSFYAASFSVLMIIANSNISFSYPAILMVACWLVTNLHERRHKIAKAGKYTSRMGEVYPRGFQVHLWERNLRFCETR